MRRPSLVEEIKSKDIITAQARLDDVLNSLPVKERAIVLSDYHKSHVHVQQKQSVMAKLLDAVFDKKEKQKQPPVAETTKSTGSISAPTPLSPHCIRDTGIADYAFVKTLGKGTFGKVKLAEHLITNQKVAIKIIEKANIKNSKQKISVDREVRLMKLLHHPHIVGVIDVYETNDYIWIIMEHAGNGELFDYIVKHGMVKDIEARRFFRQILSAVEYCHRNSIIHRDLKPENLLLDAQMNIKIIDFGFGNTFHKDRLLDTYCGSPFYAAPEMIRGIKYIGPEVDVWSLGVILYALLSGKLPFDATTVNELYEKIAAGKYIVPSHFSPQATHLISRMLTTDPSKRATLEEVSNHPWVQVGYDQKIYNHLSQRPLTVTNPNKESLIELTSYGFREDEVAKILRSETKPHPIVSLYHLIDEAKLRKDAVLAEMKLCADARSERANSLATIQTVSSSRKTSSSSAVDFTDSMDVDNKNKTSRSFLQKLYNQNPIATPSDSLSGSTASNYTTRYSRRSAPNESTSPTPAYPSPSTSPTKGFKNFFNYTMTTDKSFMEICVELEKSLDSHFIKHGRNGNTYVCTESTQKFEVDITRKENGSHVLSFRKVQGNFWVYKTLCGKVLKDLQAQL